MREANKTIKRTRYPTPTVEDILAKVKGAKVFTKLDLKSAFHQIEMTPESRKMTTFQSETRIKRYTRLMFGANSASRGATTRFKKCFIWHKRDNQYS